MAKFVLDAFMDAALDEIIDNAERIVVCDGEPADYTDATTDSGSGGHALGEAAVGAGDFTKADGDVSGRKYTLAEQATIDVDVSGTADHVAVVDDTGTRLLTVTTISNSQAVTAGNTMTIQSHDHEVEDAA